MIYDRRHRFLVTYLYDLPFGKGQPLLNGVNIIVDGFLRGRMPR